MKFAIVGYGVMGKLVEQCIHNRGEEIVEIIDSYAKGSHTWENAKRLKEAESAVCFTSPDAGYESVKKLLSSGINTIVGTTGFYIKNTLVDSAMMHEFDEIAKKNNSKMVYASNFCLSAHFFWKQINSVSSQMAEEGRIPVIIEVHHTRKKDVSGTAIKLGEILLKHYSKLSGLSFNADNAIFPKKLNDNLLNCILNIDLKTDDMVTMANQVTSAIKDFKIPIVSIRYGDVVGIHKVQFIGINDYVEFSHAVKDRTVFAEGAVKAAYWLRTRQAGVYSIDDMIKY